MRWLAHHWTGMYWRNWFLYEKNHAFLILSAKANDIVRAVCQQLEQWWQRFPSDDSKCWDKQHNVNLDAGIFSFSMCRIELCMMKCSSCCIFHCLFVFVSISVLNLPITADYGMVIAYIHTYEITCIHHGVTWNQSKQQEKQRKQNSKNLFQHQHPSNACTIIVTLIGFSFI